MSESRTNVTRRKRTASTEVSNSHKTSGSGGLSAIISVIVILAASVYLMAHNQVDDALGRTATVISDKRSTTGQIWTSVVTTFAGDDVEEDSARIAAPDLTMLKDGDRVSTGSHDRTVTTSGNDILKLEPQTTITIGEPKPATIIELLGGTLHVKAGKRHDGDTLSIETQYLVATVKGTEFVVTTTDSGAAVSVTEGVVSVRATRASEAFDVVPGQTAFVSSVQGSLPTIVATPAGGGAAALEAAVAGTTAYGDQDRR
ncbi:MAG TPA: FecR domain-containing protein [Dongiaceae bacterium]|nr:FecR domain-containing protein [Dongiaceae bacterium]